jgi:hypothetical protein
MFRKNPMLRMFLRIPILNLRELMVLPVVYSRALNRLW